MTKVEYGEGMGPPDNTTSVRGVLEAVNKRRLVLDAIQKVYETREWERLQQVCPTTRMVLNEVQSAINQEITDFMSLRTKF